MEKKYSYKKINGSHIVHGPESKKVQFCMPRCLHVFLVVYGLYFDTWVASCSESAALSRTRGFLRGVLGKFGMKICPKNVKYLTSRDIIKIGNFLYLGFIFYPLNKCNVSCLVPLKTLLFIVSSVGVSSEN